MGLRELILREVEIDWHSEQVDRMNIFSTLCFVIRLVRIVRFESCDTM